MIKNTWSNDFVGIPFRELGRELDGLDCWGLVVAVYRDVLGVELPAYTDRLDRFEQREIAALVAGAKTAPIWRKVEMVRPFDVLIFKRGRHETHIGIAVNENQMLHVNEGGPAHIARYDRMPWSSKFVCAGRHISQEVAA